MAFFSVNSVLRGWINFYRVSNAKNCFQKLNQWLWSIIYSYFWEYHKQDFKRKSQRLFKKKLSLYIWNRYRYPYEDQNWHGKWWAIPPALLNTKIRYSKNAKPYYLFHPASAKVATPSILPGVSAFHPDDRILLLEKSIHWQVGLRNTLLKKSKGTCQSCGTHLTDGSPFEIHHVIPLSQGGTNKLSNLLILCKECHRDITNKSSTKDTSKLKILD